MKRSLWLIALLPALLAGCDSSAKQPQVITYPEMQSQAFETYRQQCGVCHVPPRTTAHTAAEWPSVIARMQQHRVERRIAPMIAGNMTAVRDYLVRNGAPEQVK